MWITTAVLLFAIVLELPQSGLKSKISKWSVGPDGDAKYDAFFSVPWF